MEEHPRMPHSQHTVRRLVASDIGYLMPQIGPLVSSLYPQGSERLLRRLEDGVDGYATVHVACGSSGRPIALAAEVGKGEGAVKLSTFWVSPFRRRQGVGTALLHSITDRWIQLGIERTYVTVRLARSADLELLFEPAGFSRLGTAWDRYGEGRHELVLGWTPRANTAGRGQLRPLAS
jgi:GNAT superfamily N-acetyltransferase